MSAWIPPCLIKSQSPISAEDWDNTPSTTNAGEAQESAPLDEPRKLDERAAHEIEISIKSGILVNSHNESSNRRARSTTRQTTAIRKSHQAQELADERVRIELEIQAIQAEKRESAARLKDLQARKSVTRKNPRASKSGTTRNGARSVGGEARTVIVSASSSGRVTTKPSVFILSSSLGWPEAQSKHSENAPSPSLPTAPPKTRVNHTNSWFARQRMEIPHLEELNSEHNLEVDGEGRVDKENGGHCFSYLIVRGIDDVLHMTPAIP
ncbi:hypothetical protein B0H14DRAFT_2613086 [Mycena olivaceomarginata]|nr:hypothetical protein B0H14DRAFT_2613086 [Mycena olivaceomarginata]